MSTYYVYYHIDPDSNQVKYIGKGKGRRAFDLHKRSKIHKSWTTELSIKNLQPKIEIVFYGTEEEALLKEAELIKHHKENGAILLNIAEKGTSLGGKLNGMYGRRRPDLAERNARNKGKTYEEIYGIEKARTIKLSVAKHSQGINNPMYGRVGKSAPAFGRSGEKHPMYGKHHSDESKAKISKSLTLNRGIPIICSNGKEYNSISQAARDLGISRKSIVKALKSKIDSINGYTFQYLTNSESFNQQS